MELLSRVTRLSIFVGLAPVRKVIHPRQGVHYELSRRGLVKYAFHAVNIAMMVTVFRWYMTRKDYYHSIRHFQVTVLMYIEVGQVGSALLCSMSRVSRWPSYLARGEAVAHDLQGTHFPPPLRYLGPLAILWHTLVTLYRTGRSSARPKLLVFFWVGTTLEITLKVMILISLLLVEKSMSQINRELQIILTQRSRENSKFLDHLGRKIRKRYYRAASLKETVEEMFGPYILCGSFFFVFKISFHFYHVYYKKDLAILGENTLVGAFTGYFILAQVVFFIFYLSYVCDSISDKRDETYILLLSIYKSRIGKGDIDFKNTVKAFLLEVKTRKRVFNVCNHFTFGRESFYNMILEAVTYVYMLIQLHGLTVG